VIELSEDYAGGTVAMTADVHVAGGRPGNAHTTEVVVLGGSVRVTVGDVFDADGDDVVDGGGGAGADGAVATGVIDKEGDDAEAFKAI